MQSFLQRSLLTFICCFQKMIEELEDEVAEMRAIVVRSGASSVKSVEDESKKLAAELKAVKTQNEDLLRNSSENNLN